MEGLTGTRGVISLSVTFCTVATQTRVPVVEELVEQLQQADILHLDETHWYESGKLHWLWVAVN